MVEENEVVVSVAKGPSKWPKQVPPQSGKEVELFPAG